MPRDLTEVVAGTDGQPKLRLNLHPGQVRAWDSKKRFVCVLAGSQGGKTSFGPHWLRREIQLRGPGDYLVVTPTYKLLQRKALPEFLKLFQRHCQLGEYHSQENTFRFSPDGLARTFGRAGIDDETKVFFGHAADPESLESATGKAAWFDEAGQKKFRYGSWEAVQRRLALHEGRALITTTPYDLGWLKQQLYDPWEKAGRRHPLIDVIRFDSTENPAFSREEFERLKGTMPLWRFNLFHRAIFTRPAGLIYDSFDDARHKIPRFALPPSWPRYLGLDFGGVNTAAMFYAQEPGGRIYAYREYHAGGRTAAQHAAHLLAGEPMVPTGVGGSKSEGQWRQEFRAAGLPVMEPTISDVEVGIQRVWGLHAAGTLLVFDDLAGYLDEKAAYSRELDETGLPTEKIENKEDYHRLDAERYILGWLAGDGAGAAEITSPANPREGRSILADVPRGVFADLDDRDPYSPRDD